MPQIRPSIGLALGVAGSNPNNPRMETTSWRMGFHTGAGAGSVMTTVAVGGCGVLVVVVRFAAANVENVVNSSGSSTRSLLEFVNATGWMSVAPVSLVVGAVLS